MMDADLAIMNKGIRCGNKEAHGSAKVYHPTTNEVRECYAESDHEARMAAEEREIERRFERHLEDQGYDEARADEDRYHGVYSMYS